MQRKVPLETGKVYHVLSRSIAGFNIFSQEKEFARIFNIIKYYRFEGLPFRFSYFLRKREEQKSIFEEKLNNLLINKDKIVSIVAYCIMPTHIHLVLKQLQDKGISIFMGNILNSYTRFFNLLHKRKGPLWEGPFKNILVEDDELLFHLVRYIHLNPVTAYLADRPEDWKDSSYREYLGSREDKICEYNDLFEIDPDSYKEFVNDQISYQRELHKIKKLILE